MHWLQMSVDEMKIVVVEANRSIVRGGWHKKYCGVTASAVGAVQVEALLVPGPPSTFPQWLSCKIYTCLLNHKSLRLFHFLCVRRHHKIQRDDAAMAFLQGRLSKCSRVLNILRSQAFPVIQAQTIDVHGGHCAWALDSQLLSGTTVLFTWTRGPGGTQ